MTSSKNTQQLKKLFEKELKNKLSIKANHKTSEEQLLLKTFKYFDLMSTNYLELKDFQKSLDKLGVSGFSEDSIAIIFELYANKITKTIDYKRLTKEMFSNAIIKDRFEEVESIIKKLNKVFKDKGLVTCVNLALELQNKASESSIGIVPEQFEKLNESQRLGLKPEEIEKLFFTFYEINSFNHKELFFNIISDLNEERKTYLSQLFNTITEGRQILPVTEFVSLYNPQFNPFIKEKLNNGEINEDELDEEIENDSNVFLHTVQIIFGLLESKTSDIIKYTNKEYQIEEAMFIKFFKVISFFIEYDEDFYNYCDSVFEVDKVVKGQEEKLEQEEYNEKILKNKREKLREEDSLILKVKSEDAPLLNKQQKQTIENLKTKLLKLNKLFFIQLHKQFVLQDYSKTKILDFECFSKAVKLTNIAFFKNEISYVFGLFENKQKGTINYEHLLRTMIDMNYRNNLISSVFNKLEKESITKNTLSSFYVLSKFKAKEHPEVLNGNENEAEVYEEFENALYDNFGIKNKQADFDINKNDFINFYLCFSAGQTNDQLFEASLNNVWQLSSELYEYHPINTPQETKRDKVTLHEQFESKFHEKGKTPFGVDSKSNPYSDSLAIKKHKKKSPELIKFIKALQKRGTRGIMSLRRSFDVADSNQNGVIDLDEFTNLLKLLRIELNKQEIVYLFDEFDSNKNGEIDYNEFITAIINDISEERITRLKQVFFVLDKDNSGGISIDEMKDGFKFKRHPDVLKGKKSPEEVFAEFLDNLDYHFKLLKNKSNLEEMSLADFIDFYKNISFAYASTNDFNDSLIAIWGLDK